MGQGTQNIQMQVPVSTDIFVFYCFSLFHVSLRVVTIIFFVDQKKYLIPFLFLLQGISELTPSIKRWVYLATTFSSVAGPMLSYGCIIFGIFLLVCVFIKAYKSFVFNRETIELIEMGKRSIRRGSSLIINGPHKLMVARESYSLLTPSSHTGHRLASHRNDDDEQGPMI